MGMTIEDTISDLTELKICGVVPFTKGTISGGNYKVITEECLDTAIDTMRKYQKIDKSAMMQEIYMAGVNMAGEYQGCWVRFKEIEKIVDRYVRDKE